jgi:hypothetical protein
VIPNVLVIGEPGSGKSVGAASDILQFPGAVIVADWHQQSLAQLVLQHAQGNVLYDRLSDLDHSLGYGLLKPSTQTDPMKRLQENQRKARFFVEVMMRRRGGDIAGSPLMEEWVMALLMMYLESGVPRDPGVIPFGFRPGTDEFAALIRDCSLPELRAKFKTLEKLPPRALRAEVGSGTRLVDGVFRDRAFLLRCRTSFDFGGFLQDKGWLILERGDADEDAARTIIGAINMLATEHCERRPKPWPPVGIWLDECTNARTAGRFEEKKGGETRKFSLHWRFLCQHPNFEGGPEGYFQNCQEKHFYRCGDYALARKLAAFVVGGMSRGEESRAPMIDAVTSELMTFGPGWRYVVGPGGTQKEYVPMLRDPYPPWPGLKEAMIERKLQCIYARPEYQTSASPSSGGHATPVSSTSSADTPPPVSSSPGSSSPAERWKSRRRKLAGGSHDSAGEDGSR